MSSRHAGTSTSASSSRLAFKSAETISHHNASLFSVEKPIVVPWKFRRERRICSASRMRVVALRQRGWRLSSRYQSITADVGHRFGSIAMLSSHAGLNGSLPRASAASAATLRIARSAVGSARIADDAALDEAGQRLLHPLRDSVGDRPAGLVGDRQHVRVSVSSPSRSSVKYLTSPSRSR